MPYNLPDGVTLNDVEDSVHTCNECGKQFEPSDPNDTVCLRCQHAEDHKDCD